MCADLEAVQFVIMTKTEVVLFLQQNFNFDFPFTAQFHALIQYPDAMTATNAKAVSW